MMPDQIKELLRIKGVDPDSVLELEFSWNNIDGGELRVKMAPNADQITLDVTVGPPS